MNEGRRVREGRACERGAGGSGQWRYSGARALVAAGGQCYPQAPRDTPATHDERILSAVLDWMWTCPRERL